MKIWSVAFLIIVGLASSLEAMGAPHPLRARLVADATSISPGSSFRLGVDLEMDSGWHTYWQYSGDAGIPIQVDWQLPDGFSVGSLQWPLPKKFTEADDLTVYGYADQVLLFNLVRVPPDTVFIDTTLTFFAKVSWLVCHEICIPGSADLSLVMPFRSGKAETANLRLFDRFAARVPWETDPNLEVTHVVVFDGGDIEVSLSARHGGRATTVAEFFPLDLDGFEFLSRQQEDGGMRLQLKPFAHRTLSALSGVLQYETADRKERSVYIALDLQSWPRSESAVARKIPSGAGLSLPTYLMMAILGGLILNLMPCVLPVISLKVLGIVSNAGESRGRVRLLGLAFAAGIELTFLVLALVVIALKMAGEQIGWGFQFQYPEFVLFMTALVFVLSLSLFGVFTVNLRIGGRFGASAEGVVGSFSNGVLATILATPCTAPFLGTALGFAFSQSGPMILFLFAAIGIGMALPYLSLALKPDWLRLLPKPGPWLERFKQFMGFLLMGTVVWLLWVLGNQLGLEGVILTVSFLLALAVACWMIGSWIDLGTNRAKRRIVWGLSLIVVIGTYATLLRPILGAEKAWAAIGERGASEIWEPYSAERLDRLLAEERMVFIDFTAEWCWTCKINERAVLDDAELRDRFRELDVAMVKADWTNRNPEITRLLSSFGRSGVPLYVIYPAGVDEPIVLPELITVSMVLEALDRAAG